MSVLSKIRNLHAGTHCQHRYTTLLWSFFLLALLLVCPLVAQAQNDRTVSGTLTLDGLDPYAAAQSIRFKFWATDGSVTTVRDLNIDANGSFSATGLPRKNFTLTIKGAKWLRKNVSVNTTSGNVTGVTATLKPGDANNDNSVDVLDLDILIQEFDLCEEGQADFNGDTCTDVLDLDLLLQNFDQVGDTDPAPPLLDFTLSATQQGGLPISGTVTFAEPVTSSMTLQIACAPFDAVAVPGSSTNTVTCYNDASEPYQNTFSLNTSTVNYATAVTVFATYEQTTLKATTTLTPVNFRVAWLKPDSSNIRVRLEWNAVSTSNNLIVKRTINSQTTTVATLGSSATACEDPFDYFAITPANADCTYELYEDIPMSSNDTLLATEKVKFYKVAAEANQAVDARYDLRHSTYVFLDFKFGNRTYMGGLFAGLAQTGDNSRIGRSLARFPLTGTYANLAFRCGTVNAYFMGLHKKDKRTTTSYSPTYVDIYCQPLLDPVVDSLNMENLVWTTALPFVDLNAPDRVPVGVGVASGKVQPENWAMWDLSQSIRETLRSTDYDEKLTVAWAAQTDTTAGWAYFAKKEFDAAKGPTILHAWTYPTPIKIEYKNAAGQVVTTVNRGTAVTAYITMNGLGIGDSVTVTREKKINQGNYQSDGTPTISGLSYTFSVDTDIVDQSETVTYKITCNGVSVSASLLIL